MPAVALKDEESSVACTDGVVGTVCATDGEGTPIKWNWDTDTTQKSDAGSDDVFAEGTGVVRKDDAMKIHANGDPCVAFILSAYHTPAVSTFSSTVFANGKNIARIGDKYNSESSQDHEITTGATTVFAGG